MNKNEKSKNTHTHIHGHKNERTGEPKTACEREWKWEWEIRSYEHVYDREQVDECVNKGGVYMRGKCFYACLRVSVYEWVCVFVCKWFYEWVTKEHEKDWTKGGKKRVSKEEQNASTGENKSYILIRWLIFDCIRNLSTSSPSSSSSSQIEYCAHDNTVSVHLIKRA